MRLYARRRTDARYADYLSVYRSPGRYGIFIREGNQDAEVWEWPGLPANDNTPKPDPTIYYEE